MGNTLEENLLMKVCSCNLISLDGTKEDISKIQFDQEEKELIINFTRTDNLDVKARFIDIALRLHLKGINRLELMEIASDNYFKIYDKTSDFQYFIRSIQIREIRTLYSENYCRKIIKVFRYSEICPKWYMLVSYRLLNNNVSIKGEKLVDLIISALDKKAEKKEKNDSYYYWNEAYIEFKCSLKKISKEERHYEIALNYESLADCIDAHSIPNTICPMIGVYYRKAIHEISQVRSIYPDDYLRICEKYKSSNKKFAESLEPLRGLSCNYLSNFVDELDNDSCFTAKLNSLDTFEKFMNFFVGQPMLPAINQIGDTLSKYEDDLVANMFSYRKMDKEGNTVGKSSEKNIHNEILLHIYYRKSLIIVLEKIRLAYYKNIKDIKLVSSNIEKFLFQNKCRYVQHNNMPYWCIAVYNMIINRDGISAAYVLIPQIEKLIHDIAEDKIGDMTKLSEDIQEEYTFSSILNKLEQYIPIHKFRELRYFLLDGVDVNLRNKMMHGLIHPQEVLDYSNYVFYLAMRLFLEGDRFLFGEEVLVIN